MTGTDASYNPPPVYGQAVAATTSLLTVAELVWVDVTSSDVTLPEAGTYRLHANVRGGISGTTPINCYVMSRLFNVTTGAVLPNSVRIVAQVANHDSTAYTAANNATAPIDEYVTVAAPTTIRIQATRNDLTGTPSAANVFSGATGWTTLSYEKIN